MDDSASATAVQSPPGQTPGGQAPTSSQPPLEAANPPNPQQQPQQNGTDRDSVSPPQSVPASLQNSAKLYEDSAAAAAAAAGLTSLGK